jgi:hypothetical protein
MSDLSQLNWLGPSTAPTPLLPKSEAVASPNGTMGAGRQALRLKWLLRFASTLLGFFTFPGRSSEETKLLHFAKYLVYKARNSEIQDENLGERRGQKCPWTVAFLGLTIALVVRV